MPLAVDAELNYLFGNFVNGTGLLFYVLSIIVAWTYRNRTTRARLVSLVSACVLLTLRIIVSMSISFINDTAQSPAEKSSVLPLSLFSDLLSIMRSFSMIYLFTLNVQGFLRYHRNKTVKRKRIYDTDPVIITAFLWIIINMPWYIPTTIGKATGDSSALLTGKLMVALTFIIYTILAVTSEVMLMSFLNNLIRITEEDAKEAIQQTFVANIIYVMASASLVSFAIGNISRWMQYLTPSSTAILSLLNALANFAEAPFVYSMSLVMFVQSDSVRNSFKMANADGRRLNQFYSPGNLNSASVDDHGIELPSIGKTAQIQE